MTGAYGDGGVNIVPGIINFPNGWSINVHEVLGNEVLYQRWPPGVEKQAMFTSLARTPIKQFCEFVEQEDGKYEQMGMTL